MNKDFERCCSFLADMIIKYAPEIRDWCAPRQEDNKK